MARKCNMAIIKPTKIEKDLHRYYLKNQINL